MPIQTLPRSQCRIHRLAWRSRSAFDEYWLISPHVDLRHSLHRRSFGESMVRVSMTKALFNAWVIQTAHVAFARRSSTLLKSKNSSSAASSRNLEIQQSLSGFDFCTKHKKSTFMPCLRHMKQNSSPQGRNTRRSPRVATIIAIQQALTAMSNPILKRSAVIKHRRVSPHDYFLFCWELLLGPLWWLS